MSDSKHTQTHDSRVRQMAQGLCERHFRLLTVRPWEKIPVQTDWPRVATDDPTVIARWLAENAGLNLGLACGPQPNGLNLVVIDIDPKNGGFETWEKLVEQLGGLPETAWHGTPSGGMHLFFDAPVAIRNSRRLGQGVDVRGEGGQVVLPPSRRRDDNGEIISYTAKPGFGVWKHTVAVMPQALVELCLPAVKPMPPVTVPQWVIDQVPDLRHDEITPAEWVRANLDFRTEVVARGWQPEKTQGDQEFFVRPGKDGRDGKSAVLHNDGAGPFVNFSTNSGLPMEEGLSLFQFLAESDFGGNTSEFSSHVRLNLMPRETRTLAAKERPASTHLVLGGTALFQGQTELTARWGSGSEVFWASGESLVVCGPPGTGKTTMAGLLIAGMCNLGGDVLGQPVTEAKRVLYLAMDRPSQITRALRRHFVAADEADLDERLLLWRGPLPQDLIKDQGQLLTMAQENGCDVVIIDSLKDLCMNLSDDASGSAVNRALQMCLAEGIDVVALHHQRKKGGGENSPKPNTLDAVYGSAWITAGAGSVVLLWGEPGALTQELIHLKHPVDPLGPFMVDIDNHAGTMEISKGWNALAYLAMRGETGASVAEAAHAEHNRDVEKGGKLWKQTERKLNGLVASGKARKEGRERVGVAGRYFVEAFSAT